MNYSPLISASQNWHIEIAQKLIEAGAEVNIKLGNKTPLIFTSQNWHWAIAQKLIETGADVNINANK